MKRMLLYVLIASCLYSEGWFTALNTLSDRLPATVWGKPVSGLQAAIRSPHGRKIYADAESMSLHILIRNVTDQEITFSYQPATGYPSFILAGNKIVLTYEVIGNVGTRTVILKPGEEKKIGTASLGIQQLPPGKYQVWLFEALIPPIDSKAPPNLETGYLTIEVLPARKNPALGTP